MGVRRTAVWLTACACFLMALAGPAAVAAETGKGTATPAHAKKRTTAKAAAAAAPAAAAATTAATAATKQKSAPISVAPGLPESVQKVMARYKIPASAVSLMVQGVDDESPKLALNVDTPRNPASTAKVVTTWTALDLFGPTHTWPTRIYTTGTVTDGVLNGDLVIKGHGDPYLLLEDFWRLVGEIRHAGIREIAGDIVIDDSEFKVDEDDPAAFDGQGDKLYNVLPNALIVNFKSIDFDLDADPKRGRVNISTLPELPNLDIVNKVRLTKGRCGGNSIAVYMRTNPANPDQIEFGGEMPALCNHFEMSRSLMSPAAYTYGVFRMMWQHWGGTVKGHMRNEPRPPNADLILTWESRQLAEAIRPLNKWSNNLMARMLLFGIGAHDYPPPVTREQGETALLKHLKSRGLDVNGVVIDNGSGLSRTSRVTSRFMINLLKLAWRQPTQAEFVSSLSIVGVDGTTRKRFRGSPERGHMHLKTGSLQGVSAVTGYVHAQNGKTYMVNVMVNYANCNYGVGIELQNALLAWTFRLP